MQTVFEESVTENIDGFMTGWKTLSLRQPEDVERWVYEPERITKLIPHLQDLQKILQPEDTLCDVGCYAGYVKDFLEHERYTGIDIFPEIVEEAKRLHPGADFKVGDVYDLKGEWDITFCSRVLIHLPRFEDAMQSLLRASKKYCFIVVKVGEDKCDKLKDTESGDVYYDRQFSEATLSKIGKCRIVKHRPYASVIYAK